MQLSKLTPILSLIIAAGCGNQSPGHDEVSGASDQNLIGSGPFGTSPVPSANPKVVGASSPNVLPPELIETPVATGATVVENPTTVDRGDGTTFTIGHYGYVEDGPLLPAPGTNTEATKTEPDKNTYLTLVGQTGADPSYDYGTHFLYQGHENGAASAVTLGGKGSSITRVNLDADGPHRVTIMATKDSDGKPLPVFDGSTWDPFAQRLLFSAENGNQGGVWQATLAFPSFVQNLSGSLGNGAYEGIQNDSAGNVWLVEDAGGAAPTGRAKLPNSFVYRFVPKRSDDLRFGKLQALQVLSLHGGAPIAFQSTDALSQDIADLHSYGNTFDTKWVTLHDTDVDGSTPFDANALAKTKLATPFKRPENGQFRPGVGFKEFYFSETGDTDNRTIADAAHGGFGGIQKLTQTSPTANKGKLTLFYQSDINHAGFDNCSFLTKDVVVFVQDAGDTLHAQINQLDSAFTFNVTLDYSNPANQPARILAEGRDASATLDSGFSGSTGFQNEGDNEITGWHTSNGDPSAAGILGASVPRLLSGGWRTFYTQQHGDNVTWEILKNPTGQPFLP